MNSLNINSKYLHWEARHPKRNKVLYHIIYWTIGNLVLIALLYIQTLYVNTRFELFQEVSFLPFVIIALVMGFMYGFFHGLMEYYIDRGLLREKSMGKVIAFKFVFSLVLLIVLYKILRYGIFNLLIAPLFFDGISPMTTDTWRHFFVQLFIFYSFLNVGISFISQVNKKFGPGVLLPLMLGKYRHPRVEEKVFMFMDLKSSTTIAESLGHLKYSAFIRDSFDDINSVLRAYNTQVYQYVGDEIVLTWSIKDGIDNMACIRFFFATKLAFQRREKYYLENYGLLPVFKAGLHLGPVTAVEIGDIKRDIAYHGDTINTASRIQDMCNDFDKQLLASSDLILACNPHHRYAVEDLGSILLKGKTQGIGIVSLHDEHHPSPFIDR